jgi:hypothetical protein
MHHLKKIEKLNHLHTDRNSSNGRIVSQTFIIRACLAEQNKHSQTIENHDYNAKWIDRPNFQVL